MRQIVDFHLHSRFSRATSKYLTLSQLYLWGKRKGLSVLGTGDFTHPVYFEEIREQLEPAEEGLFRLKKELADAMDKELPTLVRNKPMRFLLSVEISNIYKRHGQVRRLHNVVVAPSLEAVAKINAKLQTIGNLEADGRPILGLDSEELLKIVLEANKRCLFIPAHIWTPWFAMFGSKSGFDSVEEAFGDNAKHVKAVETGLSADPKMCRRLNQLDKITLVSNSDAHSAENIGREANLLNCELSYEQISAAITTGDERYEGTIEFYPEEGMYHVDGHRGCKFSCLPDQTKQLNGKCPECGKNLTVGVLSRVKDLTDQEATSGPHKDKVMKYIVPLPMIIAEVEGVKNPKSKKVQAVYGKMTHKLGSDFEILMDVAIDEITSAGFGRVAVAIDKMRRGDLYIKPGYDGVYGVVKIFREDEGGEDEDEPKQMGMF